MTKHLFKVGLKYSDMFVHAIDVDKLTISYEIRSKVTGKLLEPPAKQVKVVLHENAMHFEGRFIDIDLAKHIESALN